MFPDKQGIPPLDVAPQGYVTRPAHPSRPVTLGGTLVLEKVRVLA